MEVVLAGTAFVAMFGLFVVMPTIIKRRHEQREENARSVAAAGDE